MKSRKNIDKLVFFNYNVIVNDDTVVVTTHKEDNKMMIKEFEKLTGFHPTTDLYKAIEHAYMNFDGDKTEFCKAYVENRDGLADRIARAVDDADREIQLKVNSTIKELERQIAELSEKLEHEEEWKPYEDKNNIQQNEYDDLKASDSTRVMTDDEAKDLLYDWYGFAREKVTIRHSITAYEVNRHRHLRKVGEIERLPLYNATDWNYIRFDCGCMSYKLANGNLRPFLS